MHQPLVPNPQRIRLAMLGMVEGNGHPYSWSAIINGRYDPEPIREAGYQGILDYLGAEPAEALGLSGDEVTHVWCDRREDAHRVARAAMIAHVVDRPEDVIGHVDAVIIATDIGSEHLERARPFIEAGVPIFIDKPLTDREDHLRQFVAWQREGKAILSTSAMRYAHEFIALQPRMGELGRPRLIVGTMMKSWERYGIHILESVYQLLPPGGWVWVANSGDANANVVHIHHDQGVEVVLCVTNDMYGGYGSVMAYGTQGRLEARFGDTFHAFKRQLETFIAYLRTGEPPFAFDQTIEQMKVVIAGIRSRETGGQRIALDDIII